MMHVMFVVGIPIFLLFTAVPALGLGFVLGSFLRLPAAGSALLILGSFPSVLVLLMRDLEHALIMARTTAWVLLLLSPLIGWGWHLGRKDAKRNLVRRSLIYGNGK
jgi:hypothetical protein